MFNNASRPRVLGILCVCGAVALNLLLAAAALGQSAARYRDFQLGANLQSISQLAGVNAAEATTIHSRPATIQELRWRRPYLTPDDTVQQIVFTFYDDQLSQIVVDYDRDKTAGMTDADLIEALTSVYGAPAGPTASGRGGVRSPIAEDSGTELARWTNPDVSVVLYRASYASGIRVVVSSPRLDALSHTAIAEAERIDEREAPAREVDRQKKEADATRAADEKARGKNKPAFRP